MKCDTCIFWCDYVEESETGLPLKTYKMCMSRQMRASHGCIMEGDMLVGECHCHTPPGNMTYRDARRWASKHFWENGNWEGKLTMTERS